MAVRHAPRFRWLLGLGLSLVLTLLLLEGGAALLIVVGLIPAELPSFTMPRATQAFFVDIDPDFGAWHPPNRKHSHRRACFDTSYRSNSYGALDVERSKHSAEPRVIVLGDSFATGHGVVEPARFSNRLEVLTGIPHLNFGAGGTGPTQYLMVYRHLARQFDHQRVLVTVLPANDFIDDAPTKIRYRPYWDGRYPNYTLRYTLPRLDASQHHPSQFREQLTAHHVLGSFSFFYNAADWVVGAQKLMKSQKRGADYSGYFDFSEEEFLRMRYSLERLHALVPGGRLAVVSIPRYLDFARARKEGESRFGAKMTRVAREVGFEYLDLLPPMAAAYAGRERELFLGCDGHWSATGHEFAAKTLRDRLY